MKMINQVVGENLKKIRELSGFTQEEVAMPGRQAPRKVD